MHCTNITNQTHTHTHSLWFQHPHFTKQTTPSSASQRTITMSLPFSSLNNEIKKKERRKVAEEIQRFPIAYSYTPHSSESTYNLHMTRLHIIIATYTRLSIYTMHTQKYINCVYTDYRTYMFSLVLGGLLKWISSVQVCAHPYCGSVLVYTKQLTIQYAPIFTL